MLFDVRYFEQFLEEPVLKKGLTLFEAGAVELIEKRQGGDYRFLIEKTIVFTLKKRADKLMAYTCSCPKQKFCEHLAAVMFYFQQDTLGLTVKKKLVKKRSAAVKTAYAYHVIALKEWLKPYMALKVLNQAQLDEIYTEILKLKQSAQYPDMQYDLNLALLTVVPLLFQLRLVGDETQLKNSLHTVLKELDLFFEAGLSAAQQDEWYKATLDSVRNNAVLKSEAFTFLISRAVTFIQLKPDLDRLRTMLNGRKYKMNYASRFDKLMIAKLEVAITGSRLFALPLPTDYQATTIEFIIANAELHLCSANSTGAFNYLSANEETVRQHYSFYYSAYLDYVITKAHEKNKPAIELSYLKKSFMYNAYIMPKYLARFMALVPAAEIDVQVNELMAWLKNKEQGPPSDKIADLLYNTGRLDELVDEIKKQRNRFSLLHKVLLKKLPYYDTELLELYMEHLMDAFTEAGFYHFQQHTFNKAKEYLDQLPEKTAAGFNATLLDRMGRNKQISRYIMAGSR